MAEIDEMLTMQPLNPVVALLLGDHPVGDGLGQEIGTLEVDPHHPVVALLRGLQDVGAHLGRDAGVVDQDVELPEARANRIERPGPGLGVGDVGPAVEHVGTLAAQFVERGHHDLVGVNVHHGNIPSLRPPAPSQFQGRFPDRHR